MSSTKPTSTDGQEKAARNGHDPRKRDYSQEVPTTPEKALVTYRIWRTVLVSLLCAVGAGLTASLVAVVVMGILRLWAGIPTPVELFGDFVLKHIDVHTFIHLLQTYAPNPKTTPLGLALLGMIGAGTGLGLLYAALVRLQLPLAGARGAQRNLHPLRGELVQPDALKGPPLLQDPAPVPTVGPEEYGQPADARKGPPLLQDSAPVPTGRQRSSQKGTANDAYKPQLREWLVAAGLMIVMTLVAVILFWDEIRQNFLGLPVPWARFVTCVGLLVVFAAYAVTLVLSYRALLPKQRQTGPRIVAHRKGGDPTSLAARRPVDADGSGRRQLFARAGVAAVGVAGAGAGLGLVREFLGRYASYDGFQTPSPEGVTFPITPNDLHYVVTQNAVDPTPDSNLWQLEVTGLVERPGSYSYEEVQKLPSTSRAITLECIANGADSHLMSTAIWQGVTLKTLLEQHGGAKAGARYVVFYCVDGYNISLPLDEVLAVDALLAWRMNGAELPQRHGFPMRVLIPGRYGEENVKWLTRVELSEQFVGGLYSDQGWYNGPLHTISRVDRPSGRVAPGRTVEVGGIAFAGNRGIEKVEVSTDDGQNWQVATLQPALSPDTWVMWTWQWRPTVADRK